MQRSLDYPNPASSSPGIIVLYDNAFGEKRNLSEILAHELAHEYFRRLGSEDLESYRMAMNWFSPDAGGNGPHWIFRGKQSFVEEDGLTSPVEDFANNVECYLFRRDVLKKTTPNADVWIGRHFGSGFKLRKTP